MFRHKKNTRCFGVRMFVVPVLMLAMFRSELVVRAGDWPQFMHNSEHTGDAGDERLEMPLHLVAQIKLDDAVLTSAAVVGGRAYVVDQMGAAYCVDPDAGRIVWKSVPERDNAFGSNTSSPCVAKGRFYYGTTAGNLHILDTGTGKLIRSIALNWPIVNAITLANDSIYFQTLDAVVHCLDLDGNTRWRWDYYKNEKPAETPHYGGATVTVAGKKVVTVIGWDIVCLDDLTTEAKLIWWRRPFGPLIPLGTAVSGNYVYSAFPGKDGKGAVMRHSLKDGAFDRVVDMITDQWSVLGTPAVRGTTAYFSRQAHGVIAHQFGLARGKGHQWSSFGPEPESLTPSVASPVLSEGHCLFTTLSGELVAVDLAARGRGLHALGIKPFRFKTPHGKVTTSSPAIAGGRVYFGCDDGYLYVLGSGEAIEPVKERLTLHKPRSRVSPAGERAYGWPSTFGGPRNASFVDDPGFKPPFKLRWAVHSHGIFKQTMCATLQDVIYVSLAGLVVSREQRTGRIRWRRKLVEQGYCRAGLLCAEGKIYIPRTFNMRYPKVWGQKDALFCLDGDTGEILWESSIGIGDHLRASPVLVDGVVAFGSRYFPLKHLRPVIPRHASWRYLAGSDPAENWTSPEFDAQDWKSGVGSFGYGDDDIMTHLDMRGKYTRVYVRRMFRGEDFVGAREVGLMVKYDDAFIAYLNGQEVLRKGAASGRGADVSDVESHEAQGFGYFQISGWQELVTPGINVIALEGHNVSATSSDFSLHPYLVVRTEDTLQGPIVDAWDADTGRRLWQININGRGKYLEGPAGCAGQRLMFFTGGGSEAGETLAIVPKTGKVLWRTSKAYASQSGTPSYQDGKVYLPGICRLPISCLSAADGKIVWQHHRKDNWGRYRYFVDTLSLGADYFTVNNKYVGGAKRWNLFDGTLAGTPNRRIELFGDSQGCGSVVLTSEGMALSATTDGLYIIESDTGKVLWKSLGMAPRACPSPAVSNGRIFYCPRANGMMYCFEPDDAKYAQRKPGLSKPVSIEGAIRGVGDTAHIGIRLMQETFGNEAGSFVADLDGGGLYVAKPFGLEVFGTGKGPRTLRYRYCYASSHGQSDYCDDSEHDPSYYKQLQIHGGILEGRGGRTRVVWPTGSTWEIHSKGPYGLVDSGELAAAVIYKEN
ncbi:MAG: outer membrane protein assembly factor BamB family protein [Planctomycetota bacterium]